MKTIFRIFILITVTAFLQGCETKEKANDATTDQTDEETAEAKINEDASEAQMAEARTLKKQQLAKANAEKAAQRELAMNEKIKASLTFKDASGKIVYNKAEVDPSFAGGSKALRKYLSDNLKYPQVAKDKEVEGTVFVDFIIDQSGNVREVKASDVVGEEVDLLLKEESVRVVAAMPRWNPGTQHGKAVDTSFSIPITFEMN